MKLSNLKKAHDFDVRNYLKERYQLSHYQWEKMYDDEYTKLEQQVIDLPTLKIIATDISEDAVMIASSGADAIGLNFILGSPRCLDLERDTR